ncbi:hypothetical protein SAMN06295905_1556 [Devosia lucknowensis]|uniref:Nudix hydrolase domain-containing protein n=1 Tax=Devosia lucknowensis TaxID=1096929 RepID=A0A1Y6EXB5_9HYPH|nr:NUDIX hydrolase [Devosia lucknowensis]SMQ67304.1 hypothetical protein SAMN06295905_1556 [Devosia lucknowensis]
MTIRIETIAGTDLPLRPGGFPLPQDLRGQVPAVWAKMIARNPTIWDGRLYGFTPPVVDAAGILRAEAMEDDYSAHLAWREAEFPEIGLCHMFVTAIICSSDGAIILGRMSGDTINAGRVYPPGGVLDPRDLGADGRIDAERAIGFELNEETGLHAADARKGALLAISDGPRMALGRVLHFDRTADALVQEITATLEQQDERELDAVVACRSTADGRAAGNLAPYAEALLDAVFGGRIDLLRPRVW